MAQPHKGNRQQVTLRLPLPMIPLLDEQVEAEGFKYRGEYIQSLIERELGLTSGTKDKVSQGTLMEKET